MMRRLLPFSFFTLVSVLWITGLQAQQYYNQTSRFLKSNSVWNFYSNIKMNFNTGVASGAAGMGGDEGSASVADPVTGALLFYSDGGTCWNSNNAPMPNGSNLLGNGTGYFSSEQGVCIVPIPGETQKYYLFSLQTSYPGSDETPLYYSIVDMSLNGGLGDIVASTKNTPLDTNSLLGEGMLAIQGDNCDIWLMLHAKTSPVFKAYHITTAGIDPTPVLSTTGGQIQGVSTVSFSPGFNFEQDAYEQCALAVSPNRTKLALSALHIGGPGMFPVVSTTGRCWGGLLCDFNAATGVVSNAILIDTLAQYSAAFSPDNSKLYYTSIVSGTAVPQLNQVSVSSNDSATIVTSKTVIQSPLSDMTISIRSYRDSIYVMNPGSLSLDRINQPNLAGAACGYQSNAISFPFTSQIGFTLPTEVVYAAGPDTLRSRVLDTLVCSFWDDGIKLRPVNQTLDDNYTWSNGSTDSTLLVSAAGTYWVKYGNSCHYRVDTFVLQGSSLNPVITVNMFVLGTTAPYTTYQWLLNNALIPGATNTTYTVTQNGAYKVVVSDGTCTDTSAVYNVTNVTGIDKVQQLAEQIKIYPNPARNTVYITSPVVVNVRLTGIEGKTLKNIKNAKHISIGDLSGGIYLLHVTDKDGMVLKVEKLIRE